MKAGGGIEIVTFTMSDGSTKQLYFNSGYYVQGSQAFNVVSIDAVSDYYNECEKYYRFVSYTNESDVYTNTETPEVVGRAKNIGLWEFVIVETEQTNLYETAPYYVDASFGKIYILSETEFCRESRGTFVCYELINGQKFNDFMTFNTEIE